MIDKTALPLHYPKYREIDSRTPMINFTGLLPRNANTSEVSVLAKAEFMNTGLSHSDRVVKGIIDVAEGRGTISPHSGYTLVLAALASAGATAAVSLAMLGVRRGYEVLIVADEDCLEEDMESVRMYGAKLLLVDSNSDCQKIAEDMVAETPSWYFVD